MKTFQFIPAEIQFPQLRNRVQTFKQLVWIYQNTFTIEIIGTEVQFLQISQEEETGWQCAEVIACDFENLESWHMSEFHQVAWWNFIVIELERV